MNNQAAYFSNRPPIGNQNHDWHYTHPRKPKEKAPPLSPSDLHKMIEALSFDNTLMNFRDKAILHGYFGALIVNVPYEHITCRPEGIEILLPSSKLIKHMKGDIVLSLMATQIYAQSEY